MELENTVLQDGAKNKFFAVRLCLNAAHRIKLSFNYQTSFSERKYPLIQIHQVENLWRFNIIILTFHEAHDYIRTVANRKYFLSVKF